MAEIDTSLGNRLVTAFTPGIATQYAPDT